MTAVSPYAPPRRNSLLRHRSSSMGGGDQQRGIVGKAAMALMLLALGFWKKVGSS
eukprot:CAMPEP_0176166978 /NCGR_PEP_ID=MMETSP0120_2-20121206/85412_1 /TAXON_ID=160619 /ORGANISM="Kryptoperidinium foliaceum, Strain CCMP 1326" /LENGTH=54 /DNA_ID=CAMNT_0017504557 /DNA_START=55 /DNA_END=216 /DNA_ORIENTATION=-